MGSMTVWHSWDLFKRSSGGRGAHCVTTRALTLYQTVVNIQAVLAISLQNGCIDECHVANFSPNKNRGLGWIDDGGWWGKHKGENQQIIIQENSDSFDLPVCKFITPQETLAKKYGRRKKKNSISSNLQSRNQVWRMYLAWVSAWY